ncbi:geraniol synthase, chloroplastic-like [Salvia splendens]|uniref:geraniol synthase, chloroplastic-like n=1 Tax=Salvia splendens TaxID=180675 RepID=UPI0011040A11|nr:geraniol synthase, chloroplastic-like [Salvia splendens]
MSCARSTTISLILSQTLCRSQKASIPRQAANTAIPLRRFSICHSAVTSPSPPIVNGSSALQLQKLVIPEERREYLVQKTIQKLQTSTEQLQLIDHLQRLGISYHLEDMIDAILQLQCSAFSTEDDLFTTALRFRLLRQAGFHVSTDVLLKFKGESDKFKESLRDDTIGLLSLYEASHMGAQGEEILEEAMEFAERSLLEGEGRVSDEVGGALRVPSHMRTARLEARRFIEEYGNRSDHDRDLLELAILDYNHVQAQHQAELAELTRWWKQLGLVEKLSFGRDRPLECFLWTVGLLPNPKYSTCRIQLAKTIAILLVIDDIFDTYGKMDELILFTHAIQRWDLEAMETLPEYMKICYMALYNTTNNICYTVLKDTGRTVLPYLKATWIDMIEGFMVEAKWFNGGNAPNLEEYIENGVSTAGAYMALVHLFFLIGEGVTDQNASLLRQKPYPKVFSSAGRILRLWDDLGTAKEEQERGDLASGIPLFMKENNLATEEAARSGMLEEIFQLWKDLNGELINNNTLPLSIIKVALNMARASQVIYNHQQHTYSLSVDNYVQALFFTPLT